MPLGLAGQSVFDPGDGGFQPFQLRGQVFPVGGGVVGDVADEVGGDCCGDDAEQADTGTNQEDCGNPTAEGHRVPVPIPDRGDSRHGPPQRVAVSTDVGAAGVLLKLALRGKR